MADLGCSADALAVGRIVAVIESYVAATAAGDREGLQALFHPSAHMYGRVQSAELAQPIETFFRHVAKTPSPAQTGENYAASIRQVQLVGPTAIVTLQERSYQGSNFVDQFALCNFAGQWLIVAKIFAVVD